MAIITVTGQIGSGSQEIGKQIAWKLHADYVDREITTMIAKRLRWTIKGIEEKEMPAVTFADRIVAFLKHISFINIDDYNYYSGLQSVIKELAIGSSIVIHGHGSQFILRDNPYSFHVLIVAPLGLRIRRILEDSELSEDEIKYRIISYDGGHQKFTRKYFNVDVEDTAHYDMVINTQYLNYKDAVSIIIDALHLKIRSTSF